MSDRYQQCNAAVKAARWIRHMPIAYLTGIFHVMVWVMRGAQRMTIGDAYFPTRFETAQGFMRRARARGHIAMRYYLTVEEAVAMMASLK